MIDEVKYKWLFDDMEGMKEKIRFKDRIEYRVSGKLHNTVGPAVVELSGWDGRTDEVKHFFIKGLEYTEDDWNIAVRPVKLKRLKKKIEIKKNNG
jgi:hypothetical protein